MKIQIELSDSHGLRMSCEFNMKNNYTNLDIYKATKNWIKKLNSNAMEETIIMPNFHFSEFIVLFDKKIKNEEEFIISQHIRNWDYSQCYTISYMDGDKRYSARCFLRMIDGSV